MRAIKGFIAFFAGLDLKSIKVIRCPEAFFLPASSLDVAMKGCKRKTSRPNKRRPSTPVQKSRHGLFARAIAEIVTLS